MKVDGDESRRIVVSDSPYTRIRRKCLPSSIKLDSCPILDMHALGVTRALQSLTIARNLCCSAFCLPALPSSCLLW